MITTVCMNPAFDKTASVGRLVPGGLNRLENIRYDAGGKGINVAVVLKRLGVAAACVGCIGATDEAAFLALLGKENVQFHYLPLPGKIRTNLKVFDQEKQIITEFNEPGPAMSQAQQEAFFALLQQKSEGSQYVVLSGSLPAGCPESTYQQCIKSLSGRECVLDSAGDSLWLGLAERPFLVKPNLPELEALAGKTLSTLPAIRSAALALLQRGAQNVIVSLGKQGAMLVTGEKTFFSPALQVEAKSTVGAGDAMLAGVLTGLSQGKPLPEAFRYGMAAGAASVMTEGTQLLNPDDFYALLPSVRLQE